MKRRAAVFAPNVKKAVEAISEDSTVLEIKLANWPCFDWNNHRGRVTLIGDVAHATTMYRGEAVNHGMLDAFNLYKALSSVHFEGQQQEKVTDDFESEMRKRTTLAVQMSRQACFGAHDWNRLDENSAVITKRAVVAK